MTIKTEQAGTEFKFILEGRIDTATAPDLEDKVNEVLADAESMIFDLAAIEYISSAGLRVLLYAYKKLQSKGGIKVINANEITKEVFEVTGFSSILDIE